MRWSPQQDTALCAVRNWLKTRNSQVFRLFGYAGTGKTTLARQLAGDVRGPVAFAAYTGKAALVMRQAGCAGASTIHSMIYRPQTSDEGELHFELRPDAPAATAELIIIDECSMVDEQLATDLLSFGKPVLVLGDPAQLPPIQSAGYFTDATPDIMLTEIHRQAAHSPIIRLSAMVREKGRVQHGRWGNCAVLRREQITRQRILDADQVIVGLNRTRMELNRWIRQKLGFSSPAPERNDRLVCLKNDRKRGLLNGGMWNVNRVLSPGRDFFRLHIEPEESLLKKTTMKVRLAKAAFLEPGTYQAGFVPGHDAFDFGYALTAHKAQGSQWEDVIVYDQSAAFRENAARWLYTAITRAAERLTVIC